MIPCLDKALDFRILKPSIREHGGDIRVKLTGYVEKNRAVFPTAETHAHFPIKVLIPFDDPRLRDLNLAR